MSSSTISDHQQVKCTSMEIASDKLTEGGPSNLMEATESMENSSAVATAFPTKRKAESDPGENIEEIDDEDEEIEDEDEESSDESEESSDESEEMDWATKDRRYVEKINAYYESKWITPQWDVDSFDGLEYDDEEEAKGTGYMDEKDVQDWLRFRRQHIENKGFCVDRELWPMYKYSNYCVIQDLERSAGFGKTYRDLFKELACLCLEKFNEEEQKTKENFINVEFVKVVGGVVRPSDCPKYFITFMAKEQPGGPDDVEYQAKVWSDLVKDSDPEYHSVLCRRAPPQKTSNQN